MRLNGMLVVELGPNGHCAAGRVTCGEASSISTPVFNFTDFLTGCCRTVLLEADC